jgi:hypothetical protein
VGTVAEGWDDLLEAVGTEAALKLAIAFGGRRVPVPRNANKASKIMPVIGREPTERLVAAFGGLSLVLPIAHARLAAAHRLRRQGLSIDAIAGQLWMSRAGVKNLLRRTPPPDALMNAAKPALLPQSAALPLGAAASANSAQLDILDWLQQAREG